MKKKKIKLTLLQQLLLITILLIIIVLISLLIILPKFLLPIYEENIYNDLKQPLGYIDKNQNINNYNNDIAYIFIDNVNNQINLSDNFESLTNLNDNNDIKIFIATMNKKYGKFDHHNKTYYYYTSSNMFETKITLTNDEYVDKMKTDIFVTVFAIMGITFSIISIIIIIWSNALAQKIRHLQEKINNLDNDNYKFNNDSIVIDELFTLDLTVDSMRTYLKKQEEYKNQMYQNISHDFKTPITVMKSYIEASEDGIETKEKTLTIINEQVNKLEKKVHSLLYLNKLNYIQNKKENLNVQCDISLIINTAVDKFRLINKDIDFILDINNKDVIFNGSEDMWEAIIDNILNNFMRYAKSKIKITIKNKKIILFNDGPNIDNNILNDIFTPYEKGINGVFGLGLSIVKKTLQFLNYDVQVENKKEGVNFIIK